jgi:hypothetical protein
VGGVCVCVHVSGDLPTPVSVDGDRGDKGGGSVRGAMEEVGDGREGGQVQKDSQHDRPRHLSSLLMLLTYREAY